MPAHTQVWKFWCSQEYHCQTVCLLSKELEQIVLLEAIGQFHSYCSLQQTISSFGFAF